MNKNHPTQIANILLLALVAATTGAHAQTSPFYRSGPLDGITDVPGVRVAHVTKIAGSGALRPGIGPVRTGATVVLPNDDVWDKRVSAATYTLNGNGELSGAHW